MTNDDDVCIWRPCCVCVLFKRDDLVVLQCCNLMNYLSIIIIRHKSLVDLIDCYGGEALFKIIFVFAYRNIAYTHIFIKLSITLKKAKFNRRSAYNFAASKPGLLRPFSHHKCRFRRILNSVQSKWFAFRLATFRDHTNVSKPSSNT